MHFIAGAALGRSKHILCKVGMAIVLTLVMARGAHAATVTLPAIDTNSNGWNTILMAYRAPGWLEEAYIKFDLSEIPIGSTIAGATLEVHPWTAFGQPIINVYHARNNNWAGPSVGPPGWTLPGLAELLTTSPKTKIFPSTTDFTLNIDALNWSSVLSEKIFSVVIHDENPEYSYLYMYGIDHPSQAPTLTLSYDLPAMPEPTGFALLATGGLPLFGFLRRRR
jgi:hypothetical protein